MSFKQSAYGFASAPPEGREARLLSKDRDLRDKGLISSRIGAYPLEARPNPVASTKDSAGYVNETYRFTTNAERELKESRQQQVTRKAQNITKLAGERQQRMEQVNLNQTQQEQKYRQECEALAGTSIRNRGSVGYNLINGAWGCSSEAALARYNDDRVEFSAKVRTDRLDRKTNSVRYNIVNGSDRVAVHVPPKPERPDV